jgi:DNA-binding MarR family transcriptional regulator
MNDPSISHYDIIRTIVELLTLMLKEDYVALATFRRSLRRFLRFVEEGAREAGLTPQQHQVLLAIRGQAGRDGASVGELSDALQLKPHATVGLVDRCERAGFVERSPDPHDRRVVRVALTEKGDEVLARLTKRNLAELTAVGTLLADLQKLVRQGDEA